MAKQENVMDLSVKNLSLVFAAGLFGGLINCLLEWLLGWLGIPHTLKVQYAPPLTTATLYSKLVWGGIWGLLFLIPLGRVSFPVRGLLFSLVPSVMQLFLVFPLKAHKGLLGLQLGALTPLVVLINAALWGIPAGLWLQWVRAD
jgi:hypothetical protein